MEKGTDGGSKHSFLEAASTQYPLPKMRQLGLEHCRKGNFQKTSATLPNTNYPLIREKKGEEGRKHSFLPTPNPQQVQPPHTPVSDNQACWSKVILCVRESLNS